MEIQLFIQYSLEPLKFGRPFPSARHLTTSATLFLWLLWFPFFRKHTKHTSIFVILPFTFPLPGTLFSHMVCWASDICLLLPEVEVQAPLPTVSYLNCQEKRNTVKHWMEQCFTHIEKRQNKISSKSEPWSIWPLGPPTGNQRTLSALGRGQTEYVVGQRSCSTHKQNKGVHIESETGNGIPTQHNSQAQNVRAPYLL